MEKNITSELTEALSRIWRDVLGREQIGLEQNFFELGGDAWLAVELFHKIEKVFDRLLPPIAIYQAPTIASLAVLLQARNWPPFPKYVQLKPGDQAMPVFLIHGLGGNILEFFDFVKSLQTPRAIYGLQARGIDGSEEPCSSIEEMAQFHNEAIRTLQPYGPFVLVGYSLGGLVGLEMARHFTEGGDRIALLVMVDSYPPLQRAPFAQRLGVYSRKARHYASRFLRPPAIETISDVGCSSDQPPEARLDRARHTGISTSLGIPFTPAMRCVQEAAVRALRDYRPRYYHGKIRFVKAATPLHFPDAPEKVWAKFVDQFEVETVPGNHHELLTTEYESLARVISRYFT